MSEGDYRECYVDDPTVRRTRAYTPTGCVKMGQDGGGHSSLRYQVGTVIPRPSSNVVISSQFLLRFPNHLTGGDEQEGTIRNSTEVIRETKLLRLLGKSKHRAMGSLA